MRHARIAALTAAVVAIGLVAAGCGSDDKDSGGGDKKTSVAFLAYTQTDYTQAQEQGLKDGLGANGTSKTFVSNFDPALQTKQCQDAITSGQYTAIVMIPVIGPTAVPCATAAKAANIPLISVDVPIGDDPNSVQPNVPGVTGQVVIPLKDSNGTQVNSVKDACADLNPCEVIVELSSPSDPVTTQPVELIKKNIPNAKVVSKFVTGYDVAAVAKAMPDQLAAHPGVDVILFAADSSATVGIPIIKKAGLGDQIKSIGNGGSKLGIKAVIDGDMFSTLALYPQTAFKAVAEMAIKATNGEKIDPAGVNQFDLKSPVVVTKANASEVQPEWGALTAQ